MWTLFDLDPFWIFEHNRRRAQKLARAGEPARGRIVGIRGKLRQSDEGSGTPFYEYAIEVQGLGGPFRAGVRQKLDPPDGVRLGMEVDLLVGRRRRVLIDWGRTTGADALDVRHAQWKRVTPPADGILDTNLDRKALERGDRTTAVVEDAGFYDGAWAIFGPSASIDLVLAVAEEGGTRHVMLGRQDPPPYAAHLARKGAVLPVAVNPKKPDKVTVDWAAAAVGEPGVGVPGLQRADSEPEPVAAASPERPQIPTASRRPRGTPRSTPGSSG